MSNEQRVEVCRVEISHCDDTDLFKKRIDLAAFLCKIYYTCSLWNTLWCTLSRSSISYATRNCSRVNILTNVENSSSQLLQTPARCGLMHFAPLFHLYRPIILNVPIQPQQRLRILVKSLMNSSSCIWIALQDANLWQQEPQRLTLRIRAVLLT